jgi:hypothetical protein
MTIAPGWNGSANRIGAGGLSARQPIGTGSRAGAS